jgi:hypothetical protein
VVGSAVTATDGRFAFADLPAGGYTLTAAGYAPDVQAVRVVPGDTTEVRFALGTPTTDAAGQATVASTVTGMLPRVALE